MSAQRGLRVWSCLGNGQRLDGGAMFGNAPRQMWSQWMAPDARNTIALACRSMLVRDNTGRHILFDTGIGAFMNPDLRQRYGVVDASRHVLLDSLGALNLSHEDIDVVCLSHLHFDHAGGLLRPYDESNIQNDDPKAIIKIPEILFPNATFITSGKALQRARTPHRRDRASFISGLPEALDASGRLCTVEMGDSHCEPLGDGFRFHWSDGHTPGMMLTEIEGKIPIVFGADLVPGLPWMHVPITMGYDRFPEQLIDEKIRILRDLCSRDARLFLTHDPSCSLVAIKQQKTSFVPGRQWTYLVAQDVDAE